MTASQPPSHRHKPRFLGQFLLAEGVVTAPQLLAALEYQEQFNARLGEYAVALGLLTLYDAQRVHALQTEKDCVFGEAALELGLLTADQLRQVVAAQRNDHVLLGEALQKLGYVEPEPLARALADYQHLSSTETLQLPDVPVATPLHDVTLKAVHLTQRLLVRLWDLQSKPGDAQLCTSTLRLSDRNAGIRLAGTPTCELWLGVPHHIAERAVRWITGREPTTDGDLDEAVLDLLQTVANHLRATLASEGFDVHQAAAQMTSLHLSLEDRPAVLVPLLTHEGQIMIGVRA